MIRSSLLLLGLLLPFFAYSYCDNCCAAKGGINYCDSSAGRYVCSDGDYSSCYCTRHAVMNLQRIKGCCLWQGGVLKVAPTGDVVCNNGSISEICSIHSIANPVSFWSTN